ncbi:TlpA family protein disulfide reductase [Flavobacterium nackdongense]|uniref:TlpA family protein disulfide reductase n=1 Tax=Flavobacterium nackdongense TaxID=2547394 RepID=A0A4P6Y8I7_9FLAO|nr:TlpA disulfide reductase family protein [Flavobacterium nackdongense]QBN19106.1 TlpA family protein disulfide reductase [Flavobacterium nackdongense]
MKNFFLLAFAIIISGCINAQNKKYMTFQAEIADRFGDYISFTNDQNKLVKKIQVNKNGTFKDTLSVATGRYLFSDGNEYTIVYLKNGFDLKMKLDTKTFDESIVYSGKGAPENNFLAKNALFEAKSDIASLLTAPEADFFGGLDKKKADDLSRLEDKKLDPEFVSLQKKSIDDNYNAVVKYYKKNYEANLAKSKLNNTISAPFEYENHKGGKTKLEDLKGKYVYIDVWATWCGPCRAEIPSLKKVEEKYHGKNIEFVSISVDVDKDHEKWKTFVSEKQLGGIQLFADKNWNSDFMKSFGINSIPRFILIDPAGKVVKSDAPRPSSAELIKQLDSLLN